MPYIDQTSKASGARHHPLSLGELTFALQQSVQDYLLWESDEGENLRYDMLAGVLGAINGLRADFIDRILLPYEAMKAAENGDVWDSRLIATNR